MRVRTCRRARWLPRLLLLAIVACGFGALAVATQASIGGKVASPFMRVGVQCGSVIGTHRSTDGNGESGTCRDDSQPPADQDVMSGMRTGSLPLTFDTPVAVDLAVATSLCLTAIRAEWEPGPPDDVLAFGLLLRDVCISRT